MSNDVRCSKMPLFSRFFGASEGVHIQEVTGSSPVVPTNITKGTANAVPFVMLVERIRNEPRARSRHESALYPYLRYPHNACHIYRVRAGSAACRRQQSRGKAPMQDAFAVRRMTCCSAFAANKNWHKILSGRQTPSLLLCWWEHLQTRTYRASEARGRGVCSHSLVCERVPSRAGSAVCGRGMFKRCDNKKKKAPARRRGLTSDNAT